MFYCSWKYLLKKLSPKSNEMPLGVMILMILMSIVIILYTENGSDRIIIVQKMIVQDKRIEIYGNIFEILSKR